MHKRSFDRRRIRRALPAALLTLALLLAACALPRLPGQAPPPATVKVVIRPFLASVPLSIAQDEGYFAEQGLQVETVTFERVADAVPSLAQGTLDVLAGGLNVSLLNAIAKGEKIRFVASQGSFGRGGCTYTGLLARRELVESGKLSKPADLRGMRIAFNRANFERFHVETLLAQGGLTAADIVAVDIPDSAELQALEQGSIDVAYSSEPALTQIVRTGHAVVWMPLQDIAPDFQLNLIMFGPSLLESNPDVGARFMVAYLKAVRQYNRGKTERNLDLMANFIKLDRDLVKEACWLPFPDDGHINAQSVLDFQEWAVKSGLLDMTVAESGFWEPRFIDHANTTLGTPTE